jgi:hypothetical protein
VRPIVFSILPLVFFLSACATHFHRIQKNQVTLVLRLPEAREVLLATSLNGFNLCPAARVSDAWEVTLPADQSFRYFYRVDGEIVVPDCSLKESDDFGSQNCIFEPRL